jgi:hypothetical protein
MRCTAKFLVAHKGRGALSACTLSEYGVRQWKRKKKSATGTTKGDRAREMIAGTFNQKKIT